MELGLTGTYLLACLATKCSVL